MRGALARGCAETYLDAMLRDDVIMRQIRKLVAGLVRAARFRREQDLVQAGQTLDDVLEDELGLSPAIVRAVTANTLLDMLSPGGVVDEGRALALGFLLAERGRAAAAAGAVSEGSVWRAKAKALLEAAGTEDVEALLDDEESLERYARGLE